MDRRRGCWPRGRLLALAALGWACAGHPEAPDGLLQPGGGRLAAIRPSPTLSGKPSRQRHDRGGESGRAGSVGEFLTAAGSALAQGQGESAAMKLTDALALEPRNAEIRSDLAAIRLRLGAERGDPQELSRALSAADQAVADAPSLPAARHNLALALERTGLPEQALAEWRQLRRIERDPRWLREARRHEDPLAMARAAPPEVPIRQALAAAVQRGDREALRDLVDRSPQGSREYLEEELLATWARAVRERDHPAARRLLAGARAIATTLVRHQETMPAEIVSSLLRAAAVPASRLEIADAFTRYSRARSALAREDYGGALADLEEARARLLALGNPFALHVEAQIASCLYLRSEYQAAAPRLRTLAAEAAQHHYRALNGRCLWLLGLIAGVTGNPTASLAPLGMARLDFQTIGETGNADRMRCYLAEAYDLLGQPDQAWRALGPALSEKGGNDDPATRLYATYVASWLAIEEENPRLAARFQQETLRLALRDPRPDALVTALQRQALIESMLGRADAALASLERAAAEARKVGDANVRQILSGDIELLRGELLGRRSPREAQPAFDRAIEIFRATSFHYRIARALYERGGNELASGDDRAGERDLRAAIDESEAERAQVQPFEQRIAYLNQTRSLYEAMIAFELDHGRPAEALDDSEAIKARALLDWIRVSPRTPNNVQVAAPREPRLPITRLRREIPRGVAVIEYALLGKRLAAFVLRGSRLEVATVPVDPARLARLAEAWSGAAEPAGGERGTRLLEELYDVLLRPVADRLQPGDRLVFVPDGPLHAVPFAALRDRRTERYLVEDHAISIAPSLAVYVSNTRRDEELAGRPGLRALIVADPAFDLSLFPNLGRLPHAGAEESIASAFAGSRALRAEAATPAAFLREAPAYQILHFAGHALVNPDYPLFSKLLFAASPGDPARGVLYSGELLGRWFPETRLVVLASCSTGVGRISATEGVESIARTLLATGIPTVVASLWNVDDARTEVFMQRFYRHLAESYDVPAALRAAQREILAERDAALAAPEAWAAFVAVGGGSLRSPSR